MRRRVFMVSVATSSFGSPAILDASDEVTIDAFSQVKEAIRQSKDYSDLFRVLQQALAGRAFAKKTKADVVGIIGEQHRDSITLNGSEARFDVFWGNDWRKMEKQAPVGGFEPPELPAGCARWVLVLEFSKDDGFSKDELFKSLRIEFQVNWKP